MMMHVDARFTNTEGHGVGRWRKYSDATDFDDAAWASRHLVPKAQVRVREGRSVVFGPCLAEELARHNPYGQPFAGRTVLDD